LTLANEFTPSALAAELALRVNRLRGSTGLDVVPMVVVEGEADTAVLSPVCSHGADQVFIAGARNLVEQLLSHLKRKPVHGCECVFLVDCDGRGKTPYLAAEESLLVTKTCDIEADLVELGVATKLASRFSSSQADAAAFVERSRELALPLSIVRRAAHSVSVSMKLEGRRQLRIDDLPVANLEQWEEVIPAPRDVLPVVASVLDWTAEQSNSVLSRVDTIATEFSSTCLGKDALDFLYRLLQSEGVGDVRGWSCEHFHREVCAAFSPDNLDDWVVAQRLKAWQDRTGHVVFRP
jgi:hypothetical protein